MTRSRRSKPHQSLALRITGVVGELMITVGVLLALFVVWQLWWTDVTAARAREATLVAQGWDAPPLTVAPAADLPTGDPPVLGPVPVGDVFARLYVPRFGADYEVPIASGVDKRTILDTGNIGHYPETAMPGDLGNFSLAAHRTTYSKPFNQIADLQPGDAIVVRTEDAWYVYEATESLIVMPSQVEVISPIPGLLPGEEIPELTERYITLTSCHPMFSARQRFITHGVFKYWMPVSAGTPAELLTPVEGGQ
ncbi:sortase A [Sanguibacter gelidistatuariae]|uniref:Sortase A n=1 Tax=Sanguibacter gelidistatuariae TaxID=1814289 RepID=A0A1G6H302_9MICO|nr:class E sortase [Sanguibacter gelidistatuariae]SDB88524.1 sortase A [Sanguibacter gelidistatuariae]